ncbi:MAG: ABC transporter ATP-binding protein [Candidatus Kerfeldbacteria bacterium]|nr:ABC transporter ATP-binding protein [Candidatus Kerfeldbacteria bacterium]
MNFLWRYLKQYKRLLIGALVLATINQVFSLLDPQIFRITIDHFVNKAGELTRDDYLRGVGLLLLASIGVAFVSRVAKNFQDYYVNVIVQRLGTSMYAKSVQHSFSLPYSVFEDQRSGELLAKLQKARTDTQGLVDSLINVLFLSLVGIVFVVIYGFLVHWTIGLAYFLLIPIIGSVTFLISRGIKHAQQRVVTETANLAGSTTETLRNVELVKSLGLEEQEIKRLNLVNDKILALELQKIVLVRKLSFLQGTLINALRSALLLLMFWLIFQQIITIGEMFSLFVYSFFVFTPLAEFGLVAARLQEARASVERLNEILAIPPQPKPAHPVPIGEIHEITYENVTFRHQTAARPAVQKVSLTIQAGQTVAFVGPSGSGKTTLMKLLVGLYKPTDGRITINGIDTTTIDVDALRSRMGLVAQETQLFSGTIRENLLFVKPSASDAECRAALAAAEALPILERGNGSLDTKIGEGGMKLSGGEKQRLAIARALLRQPNLLIFDEATSSLDSITERAITDTIKRIISNRPGLITALVAHRLSTVAHADMIYVLEKGQIVENGNHDELVNLGGLYAALWREQTAANNEVAETREATLVFQKTTVEG